MQAQAELPKVRDNLLTGHHNMCTKETDWTAAILIGSRVAYPHDRVVKLTLHAGGNLVMLHEVNSVTPGYEMPCQRLPRDFYYPSDSGYALQKLPRLPGADAGAIRFNLGGVLESPYGDLTIDESKVILATSTSYSPTCWNRVKWRARASPPASLPPARLAAQLANLDAPAHAKCLHPHLPPTCRGLWTWGKQQAALRTR